MGAEAVASRLRNEFLEKHRDAYFLVFDSRTQQAIGAVYYAPDWFDMNEVQEEELRRFFRLVTAVDQEWVRGGENSG